MITLSNVSYGYEKGSAVVRNMDFNIGHGRIYGLTGRNGAGKTTLLKLLYGEIVPKTGKILADGADVSGRDAGTLGKMFFMPAEFGFGHLSTDRFIGLYSPFYASFDEQVLKDCLEAFGMSPDIPDLQKLSSGQKRKVLLGFALAARPDYLLLDEPLDGMDIPSRDIFRKMLISHMTDRQTAVISTHTVADMENLLTDVIILRPDGQVLLSRREVLLMEFFLRNPEKTLNREQIFTRVWGPDGAVEDGNLDTYIYFCRKHLRNLKSRVQISTVHGTGYRME